MKQIKLLGLTVKDKVTGITGVVTSISFDLFGCVQAIINPKQIDGKLSDIHWYDVSRLDILKQDRVMPIPDFAPDKGPENKPIQ